MVTDSTLSWAEAFTACHPHEPGQPFLQRPLHRELGGRGHFHAVRRKRQLQQAAAEVGQIDAFAGRSEQHLLDDLREVVAAVDCCVRPRPSN